MLPKKPDVAIEANVVLRDLVSLQEPSEIFVKPSKESWIIWVVSGYLDDVRAGSCQGVRFPSSHQTQIHYEDGRSIQM